MSATIKVAIVEDNTNIRNSLVELIEITDNLQLVGAFEDGPAAVAGIPTVNPDVVIMDIQLPGLDGAECVRRLKAQLPQVNFLMLTVYEDSERLFESIKAGAGGYLLKRTTSSRLKQAIQELYDGGSPMTPQLARQVVDFISGQSKKPNQAGSELEKLSPAQRRTLDELAQGFAYKEIADHLGISVDGVRNHIRKIYEKLQVHSRTEAVVKYLGSSNS